MLFSVLGPLEVREAGTTLALGGPRQRSVLALLLLDSGRAVAADRLVTEIWGDEPPDGARDSLYTYVSNLRSVLGRDRIVRSGGGFHTEILEDLVIGQIEVLDVRDPSGVYRLTLEQLAGLDRMAEKSAQNLLDQIEASRTRPLARFLYGLGIRHVGESVARDVAKHFGTLERVRAATVVLSRRSDSTSPADHSRFRVHANLVTSPLAETSISSAKAILSPASRTPREYSPGSVAQLMSLVPVMLTASTMSGPNTRSVTEVSFP